MALPVIQDWTVNDTGGSTDTSITLTKPTGATINVGDLLKIIVLNDDTNPANGAWNLVDGWHRERQIGNDTSDCTCAVYWRIADTTEPSTQAVTCDSAHELIGWYLHITGADTRVPFDKGGFGAEYNAVGTSHAIAGFTTDTADSLAFYMFGFDGGDGAPFSISGAGWTETDEQTSGTTGNDVSGGFGTKAMASAGATGSATVGSDVSDGLTGIQFAIRSPQAKVFGDIIQRAKANAPSGAPVVTLTVNLDYTAISGNLLICAHFTSDINSIAPTGFSEAVAITNTTNNDELAIYYKISDGTETSVNPSSGISDEQAAIVWEIEGPWDASPFDVSATNAETTETTTSTGTTGTTAQADEVAVTGIAVRVVSHHDDESWTNSFKEVDEETTDLKSMSSSMKVLSATGAQETSVDHASGISIGCIATFKKGTGGITGSGTPQAETAETSGAGITESIGDGTPNADVAGTSGAGLSESIGIGSPQAASAGTTGAGVVKSIGSGAPQADTAGTSGAGLSKSIGLGTPSADIAQTVGPGIGESIGAGAPQADIAGTDGDGVAAWAGVGSPQADPASTVGVGLTKSIGAGAPTADPAETTGAGVTESIGSGDPQASPAATVGVGQVGQPIIGIGTPQAEPAGTVGVGLSESIGAGAPQAVVAGTSGAGVSKSIGDGTPQASPAVTVGAGVVLDVIEGAGTPQAETAETTGVGLVKSIGAGSPQAAIASADGAGLVSSVGAGTPQADPASTSGAGLSKSVGAAAPQAVTSTTIGAGITGSSGSGTLSALIATLDGAGIVGEPPPAAEPHPYYRPSLSLVCRRGM